MNPISAFLVRQIIPIFFFYGLAFFSLGLALSLVSRRASRFEFINAIPALAGFGLIHGVHEWFEMFQKLAALTSGHVPGLAEESLRLALLIISFLSLLAFGVLLLQPGRRRLHILLPPILGLTGIWALGLLIAGLVLKPSPEETIAIADVLSRYCIGIPAAILGAWALMVQQRTFREHGMPQFGRDLVWSAAAMVVYGVVGQVFVRPSLLLPSMVVNSTLFLNLFGIPVQLFRGVMATILTIFMVRALKAFEFEGQRMLEAANHARLATQEAALDSERRFSRELERLNQELRFATQELSLLLELSNVLATPISLDDHLHTILVKTVDSLCFPDAGAIFLVHRRTGTVRERAATGFDTQVGDETQDARHQNAVQLGTECINLGKAVCRHRDGTVITFSPDVLEEREKCRQHPSPSMTISLPLRVHHQVIGSIVLDQTKFDPECGLSIEEFTIMLGAAQQLGLSIENARLNQEAHEREKRLAELLKQVVDAQEAERKRIALELHDATGQSLTAVALGLRGVETVLSTNPAVAAANLQEIRSFAQAALGELRQIIANLRPSQLDDLGLAATLQWFTREFEKRSLVKTSLVIAKDRQRLSPEYETVLFRITQEALNNVAKHSKATEASVTLEATSERVTIVIADNGKGFDPDQVLRRDVPPGWGLPGIQERAHLLGGECEIDSRPGGGTRIRVSVPLVAEMNNVQNTTVAS